MSTPQRAGVEMRVAALERDPPRLTLAIEGGGVTVHVQIEVSPQAMARIVQAGRAHGAAVKGLRDG
jgi:hypothetical protein